MDRAIALINAKNIILFENYILNVNYILIAEITVVVGSIISFERSSFVVLII